MSPSITVSREFAGIERRKQTRPMVSDTGRPGGASIPNQGVCFPVYYHSIEMTPDFNPSTSP